MNADNVAANDVQTTQLATLDNSFKLENRVRCFNHTLQLAAKALLKPFSATSTPDEEADAPLQLSDDDVDPESGSVSDCEDVDDNIDELDTLSVDDRDQVIRDTAAVKVTVAKVGIWYSFCDYLLRNIILGSSSCIFYCTVNDNSVTRLAPHL